MKTKLKGEIMGNNLRTLQSEIYEVIKIGKEFSVLNLDSEELKLAKELLESGRIKKEEVSQDKVRRITLKGYRLEIEIFDVKDFRDELFNRADSFIKQDHQNVFSFPKDVKDLVEKYSILNCLDILGEDFAKRMDKIRYRGYLTSSEGKSTSCIVSKKFVAKYKALIFKKNNKPYVKLTRLNESYKLYILNNKNFTREEDSVVCLYSNLDKLMNENDIADLDIVLDEDSIKEFYSFEDTYFVNPTAKWVEMWWNYDCPGLYKYIPNIDGTTNMWGMGLVAWQEVLVQSSWSYTEVSEDITEEEIIKFAGNYTHTEIYTQMNNVLRTRVLSEEDKQSRIKKAEKLEEKIQNIINDNEKEILLQTAKYITGKEFKNETISELKEIIQEQDGKMGLDCGFLYMSLSDEIDLFKEISNYDTDSYRMKNGSLKLSYPIGVQSTTIMKTVAKVIKSLIESNTCHKVNYWTILD